jgi:hypothetical protein
MGCGLFAFALLLEPGHLRGGELGSSGPTAADVINRMLDMNQSRAAALQQYTAVRSYTAENRHFEKRAEVAVRESYVNPGGKTLEIVSASGSTFVQHRAIDKVIEAEADASRDENHEQTLITPQNYDFRLIGRESMDDHRCYVLEVIPRTPKKYLMRGRIWVDDAEFAIVRMEALQKLRRFGREECILSGFMRSTAHFGCHPQSNLNLTL